MRHCSKGIVAAGLAATLGFAPATLAGEPSPGGSTDPNLDALLARLNELERAIATLQEPTPANRATPAAEPAAKPATDSNKLGTKWSGGLQFANEDKSIVVKLGGRIQVDGNWLQEDRDVRLLGPGTQADGVEFRRARLVVDAVAHEHFIFKAEYDFATTATAVGSVGPPATTTTFGSPGFKDVYIGVTKLPGVSPVIRTIRVGHMYEPFGLEEQTSSKYITFLERSTINGFNPSRNTGIRFDGGVSGIGEFVDLVWGTGIFREVGDQGFMTNDGSYAWTTRFAAKFGLGEDHRFLHVGLDLSLRSPPGHARRYRDNRELHLASRVTSTGTVAARSESVAGLELALTWGCVSVQAEGFRSVLEQPGSSTLDDLEFWGAYAFVSVFLTGESRPYKGGLYQRVKPANPVFDEGYGAWEVALRVSTLDHADQTVRGGRVNNVTLAVNWYLTANLRVMCNYLYEDARDAFVGGTRSGRIHGFGTRVAVDF